MNLPEVPADEQRIIRFRPAFHRCNPDPCQDFGIGSVKMSWILKVRDRALTWDVFTGWELPKDAFKAAVPDCTHPAHVNGPPAGVAMAGAVAWHLPAPLEASQQPDRDPCPITGVACYSSVWYEGGDQLFDLLRIDGDDAVWAKMREVLERNPYADLG